MAGMLESDITGFEVEALDGKMGKVAAADQSCLIVKPGRLRKRHVIPCNVVTSVDRPHHRVRVRMTKHQIADAPTPALVRPGGGEEPWSPDPGWDDPQMMGRSPF